MSDIKWTQNQYAAIKSRSKVQVPASAGTGKTAVLAHRCIDLLLDKDKPADIDRLLVLTFTEDAAAEMKSRIAETLAQKARGQNAPRLRSQLMKIDIADISTIHSFCRKIIADNFYRLAIDPSFTILDGDEQKLIKEEILDEAIEKCWQDKQTASKLRTMFETENPDLKNGILKNVFIIDDFLDSLIEPEKWLRRCLSDTAQTQWQSLLKVFERQINVCLSLCDQCKQTDLELTKGFYQEDISDYKQTLQKLAESIEQGDRQGVEAGIEYLTGKKFKPMPKGGDTQTYKTARFALAEIAKNKILKKLKNNLAPLKFLDEIQAHSQNTTEALLAVVRIFRDEYRKRKNRLKCLDFNDLQRLALRLLSNDDQSPSDIAVQLQRHYQYIFVDEYQDINKLQDRIIQLVSGGGELFVVGDVKQSIYSWRQAMPELFLDRINRAQENGAKNIYLNDNFRCRKGIIDFVNTVFAELMDKGVAGMDYDDNAALRFGAGWYPPFEEVCRKPAACAELRLITSDDKPEEDHNDIIEQTNSNQRQAAAIADRIQRLVGADQAEPELKITEKDSTLRDVRYGDIVILLRSLKARVNDYVDVFRKFNIPVEASVTGNFFESPEVSDCLCILRVLDNPMQDIEFAAAMRSPVFGFNDSELLAVRQFGGKQKSFYQCALEYARANNDNLAERINALLAKFSEWSSLAAGSHIAQVVWQMLRHNDFLSFVTALPGGVQKRADLLKLHERAIQFEGFVSTQPSASLGRFVDFIEKLRQSDADWSQAETETTHESSVRIMSIHKSKGLEFPVVILPALEKGFNTADIKQKCMLDEDLPLGISGILPDNGESYKTDSFNALADKKITASVAEEMRTLYVALTRAREKLILTADTVKADNSEPGSYVEGLLENLKTFNSREAFNWWLAEAGSRSMLDWIIAAMRNTQGIDQALKGGAVKNLDVVIDNAENLKLEADTIETSPDTQESVDGSVIEGLKQRLTDKYKYEAVLGLPVKNSVSQITHRDDEFQVDYFAKRIEPIDVNPAGRSRHQDPRLVGTATHLVFEHLPMDKKPTEEDVNKVIQALEAEGAILPETAVAIDTAEILSFFETEPGKLVFKEGVRIYREYPFTFGMSPAECGFKPDGEQDGDDIIVQGVIDLLIITDEGMVVVDFKTDNVSDAGAAKRAETYKKQLRLYSYAASRILKTSAASQWLYFLKPKIAYKC